MSEDPCAITGLGLRDMWSMSSESSKKRRMIKSPYHDLLDPGVLQGLDSEAIITSNSHVVSTEDVKILGKALGNGSFCTAFRCILLINGDEMECVVKIPNFVGRKVVDGKLPTISQPHVRALVDFEHELLITRHLLEPDSYTAWYDKGSDQASMVPYSKLENFHKDLLTLQEHPGYKHIHKMIHMEPASLNRSYPMLFSEQCDKSLSGEHYFTSTLSLPWLDAVSQLLDGFEYMMSREVLHGDIKSDNVLCTFQPNRGLYHYVYTDFGLFQREQYNDQDARHDLMCLTSMLKNIAHNANSRGQTVSVVASVLNGSQASRTTQSILRDLQSALEADLTEMRHDYECHDL